MTEDVKRLKELLAKEPDVTPRESAKRRALSNAMAAYDKEFSNQTQGLGIVARLMGTANAVYETLIGRRPMRLTPAFAGGASLSVLLVATLSATYIQTQHWGADTKLPPPARLQEGDAANKLAKARKDKHAAEAVQRNAQETKQIMSRPSEPSADVAVSDEMRAPAAPPVAGPTSKAVPMRRDVGGGRARVAQGFISNTPHTAILPDRPHPGTYEAQGRDRFEAKDQNPVRVTSENPVSTFSIDVDTASYSFVRSSLNSNVLPPKSAVRVEELINYFPYDYAKPADSTVPFKASVNVFPSPWNADRKLIHIGIAGYDIEKQERPDSNLVFLLDTSGSMNAANKLPLVVNAMKLLLDTLKPEDTVAIVTYAGNAGTALEPTKVKDKAKIVAALNRLTSRGSTAGAEGIRQAYELAQANLKKEGVNRVILATDGDFNVGITDRNELKSFVERQRKSGIFLSVLGFGRGNYNDALMQTLAQNGNGNAAYIDTLNEARKVLVDEASSTLFPIAKDVKLQVEFNPLKVAEYRLIGYETRMLKREDFNNDKVDAGDIGAGHQVTAIYEITPAGSANQSVDALRYGASKPAPSAGASDEYGFLKIRYKLPNEDSSKLMSAPIAPSNEVTSLTSAPDESRFSAAVAAFGQLLKGGTHTGAYGYDDVIKLAQGARGDDPFGYRAEFINLVRLARSAPAMEGLKHR